MFKRVAPKLLVASENSFMMNTAAIANSTDDEIMDALDVTIPSLNGPGAEGEQQSSSVTSTLLAAIDSTSCIFAPTRLFGQRRDERDENMSILNIRAPKRPSKDGCGNVAGSKKPRTCSVCGSTIHIKGRKCEEHMKNLEREAEGQSSSGGHTSAPSSLREMVSNQSLAQVRQNRRRPELLGSQHSAALAPVAPGASFISPVFRNPDVLGTSDLISAQRALEHDLFHNGGA